MTGTEKRNRGLVKLGKGAVLVVIFIPKLGWEIGKAVVDVFRPLPGEEGGGAGKKEKEKEKDKGKKEKGGGMRSFMGNGKGKEKEKDKGKGRCERVDGVDEVLQGEEEEEGGKVV